MRGKPLGQTSGRAVGASAARTSVKTISAPVGGWNTVDPIAAMPATDAYVMTDMYPDTDGVKLRPGFSIFGATTNISSYPTATQLMAYYAPPSAVPITAVFAVDGNGIHPITVGTAANLATTLLSLPLTWRNFQNSAGNFLIAGSTDGYFVFNGSTNTWTTSGIVAASLHVFKHRVWFCGNDLTARYLAVDAVAGSPTDFPMGPIFQKGGRLVAQFSWTIDGGQGSDDYLLSVTSQGEMSVYQGTDPATDFQLVGVYQVGPPTSKTPFEKYGGDVIYLSKSGIFLISKLLQSATLNRQQQLSGKIDGAYKAGVLPGFGTNRPVPVSVLVSQAQQAILVNWRSSLQANNYMFVLNDITKAWTKFTWKLTSVIEYIDPATTVPVVLGLDTANVQVYQLFSGTSDNGATITGSCSQAYFPNTFNYQVSMVKPLLQSSATVTYTFGVDSNFQTESDSTVVTVNGSQILQNWYTVPNALASFHSFRIQMSSSTSTVSWYSTNFSLNAGGLL